MVTTGRRNRGGARPEKPKAKPNGVHVHLLRLGGSPMWHTRRTECSAYGKECQQCRRQNNTDNACLRRRPSKPPFLESAQSPWTARTTGYARSASLTIGTMTCAISGRSAPLARSVHQPHSHERVRRLQSAGV